MTSTVAECADLTTASLQSYRAVFLRSLAAENKSSRTQQTYGGAGSSRASSVACRPGEIERSRPLMPQRLAWHQRQSEAATAVNMPASP